VIVGDLGRVLVVGAATERILQPQRYDRHDRDRHDEDEERGAPVEEPRH
jgi:hypothetical protein